MKKLLFLSIFLGSINLFAQQPDSLLIKEIPALQEQLTEQQVEINELNLKLNEVQNDSLLLKTIESVQLNLENQQQEIQQLNTRLSSLETLTNKQKLAFRNLDTKYDSLLTRAVSQKRLIESNTTNINAIASDLGTQIKQTELNAENQISQLGGDVEKNRLYWIIATLVILLLGFLIYWFLGKRIASNKTNVETQIKNTKAALEEESLKLDNKLIEVLETQLKLKQEENKAQPIATNEKADHSLALKVADEIVRMQKNISKMGSDTKGLKPLLKGIERIQNNFAANGYEMVNHLNKPYDERFNIDVINFTTDENLDKGSRIITAVIKPQVNYKGVLIQRAQVDVSQN